MYHVRRQNHLPAGNAESRAYQQMLIANLCEADLSMHLRKHKENTKTQVSAQKDTSLSAEKSE